MCVCVCVCVCILFSVTIRTKRLATITNPTHLSVPLKVFLFQMERLYVNEEQQI